MERLKKHLATELLKLGASIWFYLLLYLFKFATILKSAQQDPFDPMHFGTFRTRLSQVEKKWRRREKMYNSIREHAAKKDA